MDRAWIVAVVLCLSACHEAPPPAPKAVLMPPPPPPPPFDESPEGQKKYRAHTLAEGPGTCDDLTRIRTVPFKGTLGEDKYYDRIKVYADHYRPCLVDALDDYTPLAHDIHLGPSMAVHDRAGLAHIMLVESDIIDFDLCQPPEVLAKKEILGALPFFSWLEESAAHRHQFTACLQRELGGRGRK